jgi:hypothetical protein
VVLGLELGTSGSVARNSDHWTTGAVTVAIKMKISLLGCKPFILQMEAVGSSERFGTINQRIRRQP